VKYAKIDVKEEKMLKLSLCRFHAVFSHSGCKCRVFHPFLRIMHKWQNAQNRLQKRTNHSFRLKGYNRNGKDQAVSLIRRLLK